MTRAWENEVHDYFPGLRFRGLRFLNDREIELDFEGLGTEDRRFLAFYEDGEIPVINFEDGFSRLYQGIPILTAGKGLPALVGRAVAARKDQLPADQARDELVQELTAELQRRWEESKRDGQD
jgi:hypothetical protein